LFDAFVDFLKNWADLLTSIVALCGIIILAYKTLKPTYDVIVALPDDVEKLKEKTKGILEEVKTNGGKSLKDAVVSLKTDTDIIRTELKEVTGSVNFIIARQWAVLNTTDQAVFETDVDGYCIRANRAYLDICGRPFDEIKGNGWKITVHPLDREFVTKEWQNAVNEKRNFESSFRVVSSTGKTYAVFCIAVPISIPIHNSSIITGWLGRYETVDFDVNKPHE